MITCIVQSVMLCFFLLSTVHVLASSSMCSCILLCCHRNQTPASFFFSYNSSLGPPYRILVDTNFINFAISCKLDVLENLMTCLKAKCKFVVATAVTWVLDFGQAFQYTPAVAIACPGVNGTNSATVMHAVFNIFFLRYNMLLIL